MRHAGGGPFTWLAGGSSLWASAQAAESPQDSPAGFP